MLRARWIAVVFIFAICLSAYAQEPLRGSRSASPPMVPPEPLPPGIAEREADAWSLDDLEQLALANNPSLARRQALLDAARGNWLQVGLPPNPAVGYEGQQLGSRGLAEQDGVFVEQEFVRGGKLRLNRDVAAYEIRRAEQELVAQRQRVQTDVRIAFFDVLIAGRQEQVTGDLQRVAQEGVNTADTLFKGKEVGRADVAQAELELENTGILVQNARNRRVAAWQNLAAITGQQRLDPRPLAGDPEERSLDFSYDSMRERLLSASPEIAVAIASVEQARASVARARVEAVPNVTVQGLVNWRDNGIGGKPDGSLTVGIPIPTWNRNQGGIQQSQAHAVAAERALDQLELELSNRLAPVYERYANARNQTQRYQQRILPAAQDVLNLTRRSYAAGEASYVTLLTAQRTYSQTHLNYLEALRALRTSESELEGLLLSNSLNER